MKNSLSIDTQIVYLALREKNLTARKMDPRKFKENLIHKAEKGDIEALMDLIVQLLLEDEKAQAKRWCEKLTPEDRVGAYLAIGWGLKKAKAYQKSESFFLPALEDEIARLEAYEHLLEMKDHLSSSTLQKLTEVKAKILQEAEQGNPEAEFQIATLLDKENNIEEALFWYKKAAQRGCEISADILVSIYGERGDEAKASKWYAWTRKERLAI